MHTLANSKSPDPARRANAGSGDGRADFPKPCRLRPDANAVALTGKIFGDFTCLVLGRRLRSCARLRQPRLSICAGLKRKGIRNTVVQVSNVSTCARLQIGGTKSARRAGGVHARDGPRQTAVQVLDVKRMTVAMCQIAGVQRVSLYGRSGL